MVCVNTDAPEVEHLVTVCGLAHQRLARGGAHGRSSRKGSGDGRLGQLSTVDHAQKVTGFRQALSRCGQTCGCRGGRGAGPRKGGLQEEPAGADVEPDIGGVYVSTVNSVPVLRAIEDVGLDSRTTVITSDLSRPSGVHRVGTGGRHMSQRPSIQGRRHSRRSTSSSSTASGPAGDPDGSPHRDEGQPEALHGPSALARDRGRPDGGEPEGDEPESPEGPPRLAQGRWRGHLSAKPLDRRKQQADLRLAGLRVEDLADTSAECGADPANVMALVS